MSRVSCSRWRHDIWILEKLKFDYLKNEKSFRSEIRNIFPCFRNAILDMQNKPSKMQWTQSFKFFFNLTSLLIVSVNEHLWVILLEGLWSREAEKLGVDRNEGEFCVTGSTSVTNELKSLSAIRKESLFRLSLFIILSFWISHVSSVISKTFTYFFKISCFNDFFVNADTICTLILASNSVNSMI